MGAFSSSHALRRGVRSENGVAAAAGGGARIVLPGPDATRRSLTRREDFSHGGALDVNVPDATRFFPTARFLKSARGMENRIPTPSRSKRTSAAIPSLASAALSRAASRGAVRSKSAPRPGTKPAPDIVCLSHLRWDFVFQRPQHLLTRFAREGRVFYVEEPELLEGPPGLSVTLRENGVHVVVPRLPGGLPAEEQASIQKELLDDLLRRYAIRRFVLWFYTPMALALLASPGARSRSSMTAWTSSRRSPALLAL